MKLELEEIDLSKGDRKEHPDINDQDEYVAFISGSLRLGTFVKVWFGWHFQCGWGASGGMQYDPPGTNASGWKQLWRIKKHLSEADILDQIKEEERRKQIQKKLEEEYDD